MVYGIFFVSLVMNMMFFNYNLPFLSLPNCILLYLYTWFDNLVNQNLNMTLENGVDT